MNIAPADQQTILLYFYSTLPQVLGAMLALVGVFVIFKFESLKNQSISELEQFLNLRSLQNDEAIARTFDISYFSKKNSQSDALAKRSQHNLGALVKNLRFLSSKKITSIFREKLENIQKIVGKELEIDIDIDSNLKSDGGMPFQDKAEFKRQLLIQKNKIKRRYILRTHCVRTIEVLNSLSELKKDTKALFRLNGIFLGALILYFFAIPFVVSHDCLFWISIVFGSIIILIAIYLIVSYLRSSFDI